MLNSKTLSLHTNIFELQVHMNSVAVSSSQQVTALAYVSRLLLFSIMKKETFTIKVFSHRRFTDNSD